MPWTKKKNGDETCVYKADADGKPAGDSLKCYSGDTQTADATAYIKALYANSDKGKESYSELERRLLYIELEAKDDDLRKIDGMAAGTFTAKSGKEVTFDPKDLPTFIENTMAVIESTRTEKGEIVGLPIDMNSHDHNGGAGWIVGLEHDEARSIIKFIVKWTKDGIGLIKDNVRRFFSPTVDPVDKIIFGGSLTNMPATRNDMGGHVLRPVELSQHEENQMNKTVEELLAENEAKDAKIAELTKAAGVVTPDMEARELQALNEWMNDGGEGAEQLSEEARGRAELVIRVEKRKQKVVEFAAKIVGGTKEKPYGLPIRASRLVKLLLKLPEDLAEEVQNLIALVYKNAIDFAEKGISGSEFNFKPRLPEELQSIARIWVDGGKDIKDWFKQMGDGVGAAEDYNLSEFQKEVEN